MLIIRELLLGSRHFNDIRRGVPKMSPSLLSKRLHDLTRAGIVERRNDGHEVEYTLTAAGKELQASRGAVSVPGECAGSVGSAMRTSIPNC